MNLRQITEEEKRKLKAALELPSEEKFAENTENRDLIAVEKASRMVGDSKIVALGELTHGIGNINIFRNRFIEALIEHKSFKLVAFEGDYFRFLKLNDFVLGKIKEDELPNLIKNDFKMFHTKEFVHFLHRLRNYNNKFDNDLDKIQIAGVDKGFIPDIMIDCIKKISFENPENQNEFIKLINKMDNDRLSVMTLYNEAHFTPGKSNREQALEKVTENPLLTTFQGHCQKLYEWIDARKEYLKKSLSPTDYQLFFEDLKILQSFYQDLSSHPVNRRDQGMAQVFISLQKALDVKAIFVAHNGHVAKEGYAWQTNIDEPPIKWSGQHLAEEYGDQLKAIGAIAYEGKFAGTHINESYLQWRYDVPLHKAPEDSIESLLHSLDVPQAFIDLRNNNLPELFAGQLQSRTGQGYQEKTVEECFEKYNLAKGFDAIIYVDHAIPSQPFFLNPEIKDSLLSFFKKKDEKTQEPENKNNGPAPDL